MALTPAQHRAMAEQALDNIANMAPGTSVYGQLTNKAIAHSLLAIATYLEPPPAPEIPGLPKGWKLTTAQSNFGERLWGYTLTVPGRPPASNRHRWKSSSAALVAGLKAAKMIAARMPELNEKAHPDAAGPAVASH
jgi:hypothetical protein